MKERKLKEKKRYEGKEIKIKKKDREKKQKTN